MGKRRKHAVIPRDLTHAKETYHASIFRLPRVIKNYEVPDECVTVVRALIDSAWGNQDYLEYLQDYGIKEKQYHEIMAVPEQAMWVCAAVSSQLRCFFGRLDLAMFYRAIDGNVPAYRALMERYGQSEHVQKVARFDVAQHTQGMNLDEMTPDQLTARFHELQRTEGISKEPRPEEASDTNS